MVEMQYSNVRIKRRKCNDAEMNLYAYSSSAHRLLVYHLARTYIDPPPNSGVACVYH